MKDVALISIEPASAAIAGSRVMARALEALAAANAEIPTFSSSSYRQSFCFLVRRDEVERVTEQIEAGLALEFAHGYLKPLDVDQQVGLLAVVREGMPGTSGLAGEVLRLGGRDAARSLLSARAWMDQTRPICSCARWTPALRSLAALLECK